MLRILEKNTKLNAFVMSSARNRSSVPSEILGCPLRFVDSDSPANARYATLMNVGNAVAFGGTMGMPEWVMLDCGLLPAFFVGLEGPASLIAGKTRDRWDELWSQVAREKDSQLAGSGLPELQGTVADDEIVPLAEFCAIPCVGAGRIMGFSLFALPCATDGVKIDGMGTVCKALGLAIHRSLGATTQTGVTQYDNPALRVHCRFGDLRIQQAQTPLHTKGNKTFIYEMDIPDFDALRTIADLAAEKKRKTGSLPSTATRQAAAPLDPRNRERLMEIDQRLRAGTHTYRVVCPGLSDDGAGAMIVEAPS